MKKYLTLFFALLISTNAIAQIPAKALVGYFHNWNTANAPYIQLDQIDNRYNVVNISFATPQGGTDYDMDFTPSQTSQTEFITQIQNLQAQGKKVLISIGGANVTIQLDDANERDIFVTSMTNIIETYGFDGIDIDLESSSLLISGGTISDPIDPPIINMITAIEEIMADYFMTHDKKLLLTMAPETAYVQGGQSNFSDFWGAYLPLIDALRDSIDLMMVQLYNSGTMFGIDGNIYTQATTDFIVAMTEASIEGFNTNGGFFNGLPANKIIVALPACESAAGSGFTDPVSVQNAMLYLKGNGIQPGAYTLFNEGGYPDLRGMMTWSINWDAVNTCGNNYEFAQNFELIFGPISSTEHSVLDEFRMYPNPVSDLLHLEFGSDLKNGLLEITDMSGKVIWQSETNNRDSFVIDVRNITNGFYFVKAQTLNEVRVLKLVISR